MSEDKRIKHNKYMLEMVECPCGTVTARSNLSTHRKTNKHQKWVNTMLESSITLASVVKTNDEEYITKKLKELKELHHGLSVRNKKISV